MKKKTTFQRQLLLCERNIRSLTFKAILTAVGPYPLTAVGSDPSQNSSIAKLAHFSTCLLIHLSADPQGQTLPYTAPRGQTLTITLYTSFFILHLNYPKLSCKKDFTVILQLFYKDVPLFWYFISVGEITLAERDK